MATTTIGDLAHDMMLRRQNTQVKKTMTRLTEEMASGRAADTTEHLGGRFSHLSQIEHDMSLSAGYKTVAEEARVATMTMQHALNRVNERTTELVSTAALASTAGTSINLDLLGAEARGDLDTIVSALNTNVAGRYLFGGVAVSDTSLASADTLMAGLLTAVGGAVTATDVMAAADTFFDAPGGDFETSIYLGATVDLAPFQLGAGESVNLGLRADDAALRDVLKHVALTALIDNGSLSLGPSGRDTLLGFVIDGLLTAQDKVTSVRADLGFAEDRIARAATRIETERGSYEMARNTLLSVDLYDTATELEAAQVQLETLYTITARTSRLSLVNFLS